MCHIGGGIRGREPQIYRGVGVCQSIEGGIESPSFINSQCVMLITHIKYMGECFVVSYIIRTFVLSVVKSETGSIKYYRRGWTPTCIIVFKSRDVLESTRSPSFVTVTRLRYEKDLTYTNLTDSIFIIINYLSYGRGCCYFIILSCVHVHIVFSSLHI